MADILQTSVNYDLALIQSTKAALNRNGEISSIVRNGDGTIASAVIDGNSYVFTWSSGLLATVVGNNTTKTFTYSGSNLTSVVVS